MDILHHASSDLTELTASGNSSPRRAVVLPLCSIHTLYLSHINKMAQKSILTVLFALFIGVLFLFTQQAEAAKGPIITNKVRPY
jgi:hypothetical protein